MRHRHRIGLALAVLSFGTVMPGGPAQAAATSADRCRAALRQLVVPALAHPAMPRRQIRAELAEGDSGVYSVRLFAVADSPDNLDGQVTIGWVTLDTNAMQALDVTADPDHPEALAVDPSAYRSFVARCLGR